MGKDYRNQHNQDKRFRGKKFEQKPGKKAKKHGNNQKPDEFDDSFIDRIDERNYRR